MATIRNVPFFSRAEAAAIARKCFGVEGTASGLPSERDQNFLIRASGGSSFVLKIANALEREDVVESQNAALIHVRRFGVVAPEPIPPLDGSRVALAKDAGGVPYIVRLLTWVDGAPFGSLTRHPPKLLGDLGARLGELDRALASFDHAALDRPFQWNLLEGVASVRRLAPLVDEPALRRFVLDIADEVEKHDAPLFARLPRATIHNDTNDYNILVANGRVAGFIDFGDLIRGLAISDLAIALAYVVLQKGDPLSVAVQVTRAYHRIRPLSEGEVASLYGLMNLRLALSAVISADQRRQRPQDPYLAISQQPILETLPKLAAIHRRFAEAAFRGACDLEPSPASVSVMAWLGEHLPDLTPVLGGDIVNAAPVVLDLSVASHLVPSDPSQIAAPTLSARIQEFVEKTGARFGIGRYAEPRVLYRAGFFRDAATGEARTIHMGVDLFVPAGTPVRAPLEGAVHALADNTEPQDYGPVVILRHAPAGAPEFYTLYGHLSRSTLSGLQQGQRIRRGQSFGMVGDHHENGGWPAHLHFQLITDLLDLECDFPGVVADNHATTWGVFTPEPSLFIAFARPPEVPVWQPPAKKDALLKRRAAIGPSVGLSYADPLAVARGWMQFLYDDRGRRYLDAYNNVPHVGHCHPRVVAAATDQLALLNTNTRYLHDSLHRFAERLTSTLPEGLSVCYFVNSGSEANELALRLARAHSGGTDMFVLDAAYHGNTTTLTQLSPYKYEGPGGSGAPPWVHKLPLPDVYRGPFNSSDANAGQRYGAEAAAAIRSARDQGRRLAAFIAEGAPSVGGQLILPSGYLVPVYAAIRAAGGVAIADEVQTAYGRLGRTFYAFESQGVIPDIVVLGKPIGNGYPLGAVVTTKAIAASFNNGMEFFSTFGGSTVSCAVGLAVLDVVDADGLQQHANAVGEVLLGMLGAIGRRREIIGDVRGSGLFLGVELVRNQRTLDPATTETTYVVNRLREEGILVGSDGPFANVIKIRPPMPFSVDDAEHLCRSLDRILREL